MENKIKNIIERQLKSYLRHLDKSYGLKKISPLLFRGISEFILRKGKRIRPILFTVGYMGFARKAAANLYRAALSIELLHDFLLIHDDIIDKSDLRRGAPALHQFFEAYLKRHKHIKFNGRDLAIVAADAIYATAIDAFVSIKENMARKEKALKTFIRAALYTTMGEFIELLSGLKDLDQITEEDIYRIYDYKTAHYTFAAPLASGAILAGAGQKEVDRLYRYGIYLGRAFQIKDDILGIFGKQSQIGKSPLTDLQEGKKTLLIWYAFKNSGKKGRAFLEKIFARKKLTRNDLILVRKLIKDSKSLDNAKSQISDLIQKSKDIIARSAIRKKYKVFLNRFCRQTLA